MVAGPIWQLDLTPPQGEIFAAVLEVGPQTWAYFNDVLRRNGEVPSVEKDMEVASQEESVSYQVLATTGVGTDVRGLEDGKDASVGHRAAPMVGVSDEDPERPLAEARLATPVIVMEASPTSCAPRAEARLAVV